jgi:hypothetical protein
MTKRTRAKKTRIAGEKEKKTRIAGEKDREKRSRDPIRFPIRSYLPLSPMLESSPDSAPGTVAVAAAAVI